MEKWKCVKSDNPDCCIVGNIYEFKNNKFIREDGYQTISNYNSIEDFNSSNVGCLMRELYEEKDAESTEKIDNPLSLVKSGVLVVRRDSSKAIILECKKGLYLAAKDLIKIRDLSDYETNGDCKSFTDAFDIMEIYDLDVDICDFDIRNRKLLWKRKSIEIEKIEKEIDEHKIIITVLRNKLQELKDN